MDKEIIGKFAFYVTGNGLKVCKICSYDTIKKKYRIVPQWNGGITLLRKREFVYPMDEVFKKYKRFLKEI